MKHLYERRVDVPSTRVVNGKLEILDHTEEVLEMRDVEPVAIVSYSSINHTRAIEVKRYRGVYRDPTSDKRVEAS